MPSASIWKAATCASVPMATWVMPMPSATLRRLSASGTTSALETPSVSKIDTRRAPVVVNTHSFGKESTAFWSAAIVQRPTLVQKTRSVFSLAATTVSASALRDLPSKRLGFVETSTNAKKSASGPHVEQMRNAGISWEATSASVRQGTLETHVRDVLPFEFDAVETLIAHRTRNAPMDSASVCLHTFCKGKHAKIPVHGYSVASTPHALSRQMDPNASVILAVQGTHRQAAGM